MLQTQVNQKIKNLKINSVVYFQKTLTVMQQTVRKEVNFLSNGANEELQLETSYNLTITSKKKYEKKNISYKFKIIIILTIIKLFNFFSFIQTV